MSRPASLGVGVALGGPVLKALLEVATGLGSDRSDPHRFASPYGWLLIATWSLLGFGSAGFLAGWMAMLHGRGEGPRPTSF